MDKYFKDAAIPGNEHGLFINGKKYSYSITKPENHKQSLIIKLYDPDPESNIYYLYAVHISKLVKDIPHFYSYEDIDEMISSLNDVFSKGDAHIIENDDIIKLELNFNYLGTDKKSVILLNEHDKNYDFDELSSSSSSGSNEDQNEEQDKLDSTNFPSLICHFEIGNEKQKNYCIDIKNNFSHQKSIKYKIESSPAMGFAIQFEINNNIYDIQTEFNDSEEEMDKALNKMYKLLDLFD